MITNEEWKPIKGFTRYEVSNMGNVRNIHTKQMKAVRKSKTGYCITDLKENGTKTTKYIHRLVAEAFVENVFSFSCVNHKDEDKANNRADNLEWCSVEYNNKYGTHNAKIKETKTRKCGKKVLQIDCKTGEVINEYGSITEAANAMNVTKQAIGWGASKESHTACGFRWVVMK